MKSNATASELLESPARSAYEVTPHDTEEIGEFEPRGIRVGTGGNISMILLDDDDPVTLLNVQDGEFLPVRPRIIRASGTSASDIVAFY